jgi:hypothetical protein
VADHCGLFGANMYSGATDPTGTVTTGQTAAPTAAPTSYPTRSPTSSPTAVNATVVVHRTDAPTAAPTAYPTAVHHEGIDIVDDNGNMSKHVAGRYNITLVSLGETVAPTGFPTAFPTAAPTAAPTTAAALTTSQ